MLWKLLGAARMAESTRPRTLSRTQSGIGLVLQTHGHEQDLIMQITTQQIEDVLASFFRRCEAAKSAGGIAHRDFVDGTDVPDGWVLDFETYYWLPPNVHLLGVGQ